MKIRGIGGLANLVAAVGNELGRAFYEDNKKRGEITAEFARVVDAQFAEMNDQ